jgi:adenylate cyclase
MSMEATRTKRWFGFLASPPAVAAGLVLVALGVTLALRYGGLLQFLEFQAYDFFIRRSARVAPSESIVLVEMTEADIGGSSLDYPLYDVKLAELLRLILADGPAVIGLDIWRDVPVPKDGTGLEELNGVLAAHSNIIGIFTLAGIAPPAILGLDPDRVAFNDNFPVDYDVDHTVPKVRRSKLFAPGPTGDVFDAFPFSLARLYLERRGIDLEEDPEDPASSVLGKARLRPFRSDDGAYVGADAGGIQMLIDFGCEDQFTRYSVGTTLGGEVPAGAFRDKIVIVGINAASVEDVRVTPLRHDHRGIEVQAQVVDQVLRQALAGEVPLRSWSDGQENGWLLGWCVVGGMLGYRVRSLGRLVLWGLAGVAAAPLLAWAAFSLGWWIPALTPAVGFSMATALVVSQVSSHERAMRSVLMRLYSRHVSKEIAEAIWANRDAFLKGGRPLAQKLVVTVLFTDLKGFSTISEKMEPAQLYGWLNGYLGAMAQVIQRHGGVLKQFTGDGILALFGVPVPHTTRAEQAGDARAAVTCALAMGRQLVELSREWRQSGLPVVSMRAGITTGEVAAGSIGSDDRFEYAVVGDVVNTAARLESYDKTLADPDELPMRCRVLIGAPTHELLEGGFLTREIGLLEVKGKASKVAVFQVMG